ncbi:MAG: hypothetical protein HYX82_02035 [Chloroflexi bacterium]|nr:hypothetical protein [Chloroflexota bacterium]
MNLGSLVTIANQALPNFIHFVFENDIYWVTGGQPVPGVGKFNFAALARAAGYRKAYEFDDLESFKINLGQIFQDKGPTFVCLKVSSSVEDRLPYPARKTEDALPEMRETLKKLSSGAPAKT